MEDVLDGWAGTLLVVSQTLFAGSAMCDRQWRCWATEPSGTFPAASEQYLLLRQGVRASAAAQGPLLAPGSVFALAGPAGAGDRNSRQSAADLREAKKDLIELTVSCQAVRP